MNRVFEAIAAGADGRADADQDMFRQYFELPTTPVKELMSTDLHTVSPQTDIMKVAELFLNNRYRRLPVLDEGRVVGQISRRDVLKAIRGVHRLAYE